MVPTLRDGCQRVEAAAYTPHVTAARIPIRFTRWLAGAVCLSVAACTVPTAASPAASLTPDASAAHLLFRAPTSFYYPAADAVTGAAPGELIDVLEMVAPPGMRAWTVMYGSTGLNGEPIVVSGMILAPADPPSGSGYPVVAWAHGTTGIADSCAPSRAGSDRVAELAELAAAGYVVTATDYEGLGTAGTHPYIIGISEGRSVLDSIRAVQHLPQAHAANETVVVGLSQGGHAALWAGQLAPAYAPELDIRGALAGSPPADLSAWASWTFDAAASGQIGATRPAVLLFGVWSEIYGLPLPFLTDRAQEIAATVRDGCDFSGLSANPYVSDPTLIPEWNQRLLENSPGAARTRVPFLVVAPSDDQLVWYESQVAGVGAMCAIGDTVELRTVSGGHDALLASPSVWRAAQEWITARFAGEAATSTCGFK